MDTCCLATAGEELGLKVVALLGIALLLPLFVAAGLALRADDLSATERSANPLLTAPTPRTVTDERQLRIVTTAIPGPEIAAGAAHGTLTSVVVKPGDVLADGAVLFQVDGIDRVGFASSIPFFRPIASGTEGADVAELNRLLVSLGLLDSSPANPKLPRSQQDRPSPNSPRVSPRPERPPSIPHGYLPAGQQPRRRLGETGGRPPGAGTRPGHHHHPWHRHQRASRLREPGAADLRPGCGVRLRSSTARSSPSTRLRSPSLKLTCLAFERRRKRNGTAFRRSPVARPRSKHSPCRPLPS